ncbi:hypothetical protein [Raoultella terrigena]|nr:hypothetical protein [Raoultella terrigena]
MEKQKKIGRFSRSQSLHRFKGKRGCQRTGNNFIKALQACPDNLSP